MKSKFKVLSVSGLALVLSIYVMTGVSSAGVKNGAAVATVRKSTACSTFPSGYTKSENALKGSRDLYTKTGSSNTEIYLSSTFASCADSISVYAQGVGAGSIAIYRMGYYGGSGARLISTQKLPRPLTSSSKNIETSYPGVNGVASTTVTANFPEVATLNIDSHWVPGMYAVKIFTKKYAGIAYLAVGNKGGAEKTILVSATNTFQAYNRFGGHSAYYQESYVIDYRRPLPVNANANFAKSESRLLYLLEENGIDTAVTTDEAFRDNANLFSGHKVVILPTHSEYWSQSEMDQISAASKSHLAILNFGGNEGWWRISFGTGGANRTFNTHKAGVRDPIAGGTPGHDYVSAGLTTTPLFGTSYGCLRAQGIPVAPVNSWLLAGTLWNQSASANAESFLNLPALFLSQDSEIDTIQLGAPSDIQYLAQGVLTGCQGGTSSDGQTMTWAISYRPFAPDHGMTFNAGTEGWGFSLNNFRSPDLTLKSDSHDVEIMTMNVINRALAESS